MLLAGVIAEQGAVAHAVLSVTEAGDALAASAQLQIAGSAALTEIGDILLALAVPPNSADLTITEADDVLAGLGFETPDNFGNFGRIEAGDSLSAIGAKLSPLTGTLATTEAGDSLSGAGANIPSLTGTLATTEAADSLSGAGANLPSRTGSLATTEADDTLDAVGSIPLSRWNSSDCYVGEFNLTNSDATVAVVRPQFITVAVDLDNKRSWYWNPNTQQWNSSGTANPATNTGGSDISDFIGSGVECYAMWSGYQSGNTTTANFASPRKSVSGFTPWGGTWNSSDKSSSITLSNGDLTAARATGTGWVSLRPTNHYSSGKYIFDIGIDAISGNGFMLGLANSSASLSSYPGSTTTTAEGAQCQGTAYGLSSGVAGPGVYDSTVPGSAWRVIRAIDGITAGKKVFEVTAEAISTYWECGVADASVALGNYLGSGGAAVGYVPSSGSLYGGSGGGSSPGTGVVGNIFMIAVDADVSPVEVYIYDPHTSTWSGDPVARTNPRTITPTGALYPAFAGSGNGTNQATLNVTGPFSNTVPSGYSAWS